MKKLIVLLAGIAVISGNLLAEDGEFSYDFSKTELKYKQHLYHSKKGSFVTEEKENEAQLNMNLKYKDTKVRFEAEFTEKGKDDFRIKLQQKINERLKVQVMGELNFGADEKGLKAARTDDVWIKYIPEKYKNTEIAFYPYDMDFEIGDEFEQEYSGYNTAAEQNSADLDQIDVPGIRITYKGENIVYKFGLGARQVKDKDGKNSDTFHFNGQIIYDKGPLMMDLEAVYNTQDEFDTATSHGVATLQYAANLITEYKINNKYKIITELGTGKNVASGSKNGFGLFAELQYKMDKTFDSFAKGTYYINLQNQNKYYMDGDGNDGYSAIETGVDYKFGKLTMNPFLKYETIGEENWTDFDGNSTDKAISLGLQLKYKV